MMNISFVKKKKKKRDLKEKQIKEGDALVGLNVKPKLTHPSVVRKQLNV